jgi:hypothetical protein
MRRSIEVLGDSTHQIASGEHLSILEQVDLFICVLGYEQRSSFVARSSVLCNCLKIALAFPNDESQSYKNNRSFLIEQGFDIATYDADSLEDRLHSALEKSLPSGASTVHAFIDVSSMSRPMIARIIVVLSRIDIATDIKLTFSYCPAVYSKPNHENAPVTKSEPVIPEFSGWSLAPEASISTIIGIGFEYDWALGALEYLEPETAWAFVPTGEDERFDHVVRKTNADLLSLLDDDHIHYYHVNQPSSCFTLVESLVYGLKQNSRPILVPFGPKLFSLVCLLVAAIHEPLISVWRVSGDTESHPDDREASGKVILLHVAMPAIDLDSIVGDNDL